MAKKLTESLHMLQELDYVPGVSMAVPDFNYTVNKQKNFMTTQMDPYANKNAGPSNSQGRGMSGIGRGGVGLGGRPDDSGGIREPSSTYTSTWEAQDEGANWDETQRHGERRNLWRDSPDGKALKDKLDSSDDEELGESMGTPFQTGPVAPMDGPSLNGSRDAEPVKDEDGDDVSPEYMPGPADPMRGPGTMWGGAGTIPGTTRGWANAPASMKRENTTMRLREFFDPKPIKAEEIDNPEQDYHGDSTDDEIDDGDIPRHASVDGLADKLMQAIAPEGDDDEGGLDIEIQGIGDDEGDEQLLAQADSEPGDGDDIGSPENFVMMPHAGHGMDFSMSPDKLGAARGTYGMHSDGAGASSMTDKSSAWDVLKKVVDALGEEKPENPGIGDELR